MSADPFTTLVKILNLQQNAGDRAVDVVSQYSPLLGVIVALLIVAVTSMSTVIVFLFRLYSKENIRKDAMIDELNLFIRNSYQENTQMLNDMVRVMDVLTRTTEAVGEEVKTELRDFINDIKTHISTLKTFQSIMLHERGERGKKDAS